MRDTIASRWNFISNEFENHSGLSADFDGSGEVGAASGCREVLEHCLGKTKDAAAKMPAAAHTATPLPTQPNPSLLLGGSRLARTSMSQKIFRNSLGPSIAPP